eukprot:1158281-Pelagomonas_calceolata.AAC.18
MHSDLCATMLHVDGNQQSGRLVCHNVALQTILTIGHAAWFGKHHTTMIPGRSGGKSTKRLPLRKSADRTCCLQLVQLCKNSRQCLCKLALEQDRLEGCPGLPAPGSLVPSIPPIQALSKLRPRARQGTRKIPGCRTTMRKEEAAKENHFRSKTAPGGAKAGSRAVTNGDYQGVPEEQQQQQQGGKGEGDTKSHGIILYGVAGGPELRFGGKARVHATANWASCPQLALSKLGCGTPCSGNIWKVPLFGAPIALLSNNSPKPGRTWLSLSEQFFQTESKRILLILVAQPCIWGCETVIKAPSIIKMQHATRLQGFGLFKRPPSAPCTFQRNHKSGTVQN